MTKFEYMVNGGKFDNRTINAIIIDPKNEIFDADINAKSLSEIDKKLPAGYELNITATLQNYFDTDIVNQFETELEHSKYIYFEDFDKLCDGGFHEYIKGLKNNFEICKKLDNKF